MWIDYWWWRPHVTRWRTAAGDTCSPRVGLKCALGPDIGRGGSIGNQGDDARAKDRYRYFSHTQLLPSHNKNHYYLTVIINEISKVNISYRAQNVNKSIQNKWIRGYF